MIENIEKLFEDDIRDKKKVARSSRNKSGKGSPYSKGYKGGIITPYDLIRGKGSNKRRQEYMNLAEMQTKNILECTYEEFKELPDDKKIEKLKSYDEKGYLMKEIAKWWGVSQSHVSKLYKNLGVQKSKVKRKGVSDVVETKEKVKREVKKINIHKTEMFGLSHNEATKILEAATLLFIEPHKYNITIYIEQTE